MKVSLVVLNPGKTAGQAIPITLSQFIIGRDPECNLRPASAMISKRHCAILVKNGKVFVRDFDSTNGTFVNEKQIAGEVPLSNEDTLKVGPLNFRVSIQGPVPVNKPTPLPAKSAGKPEEESVADMLLSLQGEEEASADESGIPGGSTIMDVVPLPEVADPPKNPLNQTLAEMPAQAPEAADAAAPKPAEKKPIPVGTARDAARAILEKYQKGRRR